MVWDNIYFTAEQMKRLDSASASHGVTEARLMKAAGEAIYREISACVPDGSIAVVCGTGNNGGDGYAAAVMLLKAGRNVKIIFTDLPKGDTSYAFFEEYKGLGGVCLKYGDDPELCANEIIDASGVIDALFGFSFKGQLSGAYAALTDLINSSEAVVVSADMPSGVYADGGYAEGCVSADVTCTFSVNKPATISYPACGFCGRTALCDIGVPPEAIVGIIPAGYILGKDTLSYAAKRPENSNKGTFGTLLALCGSPGMPGAAYLSAVGALRSGVGLLELMSDSETLGILKNRLSEPIFTVFSGISGTPSRKHSAFLVGCGIGRIYDNVLGELLKQQTQTTIIDADGINYIASHINVLTEMQGDIILTPHPGEMARLMGCSVEQVNENRLDVARSFAMEFGCVLVLKGNHTVIASPKGQISVCPAGGSALAKGGSGDVLAGVIASLAAQGIAPYKAACLGVYAHALAGDKLAEEWGARGVLPHDLPREIGRILG